jgi:hypothetical protein
VVRRISRLRLRQFGILTSYLEAQAYQERGWQRQSQLKSALAIRQSSSERWRQLRSDGLSLNVEQA